MAALTGKTPAATYKDLLQVSNANSGIDATMRAVEDGEGSASLLYLSTAGVAVNTGLNIGAATAVTGGKVTQTAALSAATGDEVAYSLAYTTNKATSGADTGLEIVQTDTASPGTSYLINAKVATTSKFSVDNAGACNLASYLKLNGSFRVQVPDGGSYQFWADNTKTWIDDDLQYVWGSAYNLQDTGLARAAAAVVKVTNGSTGYGALSLDTNSAQYADTVTLTDNTDTEVVAIAITAGQMIGGRLIYTIVVTDGTDHQSQSGSVTFSAVNKAGTTTATIGEDITPILAESAGGSTLTDAWTIVDSTNIATIKLTANSSLTPTSMYVRYQLFLNSANTVTKKT